ncbi:MAG: SDR family NAD(P)-dependent oxidoreductase [Erysipelotrichaceae bacterium]|nr:SDR family NAD(P)-dependent oxidoreductase [Erysipelotrichaceae bacterium]
MEFFKEEKAINTINELLALGVTPIFEEKEIIASPFEGKTVVVTGGASGIGKHVVDTLVAAGADTVVVDLNVTTGETMDNAYCVQCNVCDPDSVKAMMAAVIDKYGKIDALVNNAGINMPRLLVDVKGEKPEYELSVDSFDKMFNVNVKGLFLCAQAAAREMVKQGKGVILNMSSESGKEGSQGQSAYSATKGACDSFTRSWAKELGKYGIRVVAAAPGIMEATGLRTPAYNEALAYTRGVKPEDLSGDYSKQVPLGRDGKLDEVGDLCAYLVSDRASYITGTTINISGGKSRG